MQKYIYNNLVFIFLAMVEARDNSFNDSPLFPGLQKLIGIEAASLILENNHVRGFHYKKIFLNGEQNHIRNASLDQMVNKARV